MASMSSWKAALKRREVWIFAGGAWGFTWLLWAPLLLNQQFEADLPVFPYQHFAGSLGPLFGAVVASLATGGWRGLKTLGERSFNWRVKWWCWAVALGSPLVFWAVGVLVAFLVEGKLPDPAQFGLDSRIATSNVLFVWLFWLVTYGLGEETGWRGYLLPLISESVPVGTAALVLAQFWAVWHWPAFFFVPGYMNMGAGIIGWYISLLFGSIFLAWLTRNAGWSVIPAILWHGTFNLTTAGEHSQGLIAGVASMLVIVTAVVLRGIYRSDMVTRRKAKAAG